MKNIKKRLTVFRNGRIDVDQSCDFFREGVCDTGNHKTGITVPDQANILNFTCVYPIAHFGYVTAQGRVFGIRQCNGIGSLTMRFQHSTNIIPIVFFTFASRHKKIIGHLQILLVGCPPVYDKRQRLAGRSAQKNDFLNKISPCFHILPEGSFSTGYR